jgi:UDP-N-acetylmuramyl pentapeptide synthase
MLFDNARAAALALPTLVRAGDVILVKGSQSIRTERIVEALLANPSDASLLVRQEREWKRRP